jgi:dephospho-CoA kinase
VTQSLTFKQFLTESANDKGIFKAIFVVGIPGAGKTFTIKQINSTLKARIVCTDIAVEFLAKKYKKPVNNDTWPDFKDKSNKLTKDALHGYLNGALPLFIDSTSNNISQILHRAGLLESLGYDTGMIFVSAPLETAIKRAEARAKQNHRHVDVDFIRHVYSEAEENKEYFRSKFSFFKELKNDENQLTNETLLKAFKKVNDFFDSPIQNPIGVRYVDTMREKKFKYLSPDIIAEDALKRKVDGWYR